MATVPTGAKIRGPLAEGGIRHWFLICAHFSALMQGVLCSQVRLRAQALCEANAKRTFNKQGGLTPWPMLCKWTWHRARFIRGADVTRTKWPLSVEKPKRPHLAARKHASQWVWHISLPFCSLQSSENKACLLLGSKCVCLWQESVRPDFHSQWHQGALWPAAKLKIVLSGLVRHTHTYTRTQKNPLYSNKLINSEHTQQTQQSH